MRDLDKRKVNTAFQAHSKFHGQKSKITVTSCVSCICAHCPHLCAYLQKCIFQENHRKKTKRTFPAFSAPGFSISATSDVSWPRRGRDKRKDVGIGKRKHAYEGHLCFFDQQIHLYIYLYIVIYLLGGLRLWCQFNCVKGNNFCF